MHSPTPRKNGGDLQMLRLGLVAGLIAEIILFLALLIAVHA
ncbi:hypothetical protein [Streptomyces sp. NPDC048636]